jgi:hypothetical protein
MLDSLRLVAGTRVIAIIAPAPAQGLDGQHGPDHDDDPGDHVRERQQAGQYARVGAAQMFEEAVDRAFEGSPLKRTTAREHVGLSEPRCFQIAPALPAVLKRGLTGRDGP